MNWSFELWLIVEAFLYTVAAGQPLLAERASNSCPSADYTAQNGLTFTTTNLCLHNMAFDDISQGTTTDLTACMDLCSASPGGQGCFGVSFTISTGECWMKNGSISSTAASPDSNTHSALTTNYKIQTDVKCPFTNQSTTTSANGMQVQVLCDFDSPVNDYCASGSPQPQRSDGVCPYHTDTMAECIDICSTASPLCLGVSWNPDETYGYGNCYLKSDMAQANYRASSTAAPVSHLAAVQNAKALDTTCTNSSIVTASNGAQFEVSCNDNRAYNDLIRVHAENMTACASSCATFKNATLGECVGTMYDPTLKSSWENCWLKGQLGVKSTVANNIYLAKLTTNSSGTASSGGSAIGSSGTSGGSTSNGGSSSKAWIAGVVVGVIAVVGLAAFAVWFLRRRKANEAAQEPSHPPLEMSGEGVPPVYVKHAEKVGVVSEPIQELDTQQHSGVPDERGELPAHDVAVYEMPTSPAK